jgi:hypothetical protein
MFFWLLDVLWSHSGGTVRGNVPQLEARPMLNRIDMQDINGDKRIAFETLMDSGKVRVTFCMVHEGVELPGAAKDKSSDGVLLSLDYSARFNMPQFKVDDKGIRAVLTFGGKSHMTFVPWDSVIHLMQDNKVMEAWSYVNEELGIGLILEGDKDAMDKMDALCGDEEDLFEIDAKWLAESAEG